MFQCIGSMFRSVNRVFNIVDVLARTGENYALHFEAASLQDLELKRQSKAIPVAIEQP